MIMAIAVLFIVLAVTVGMLLAKGVYARFKQRHSDEQGKSDVKDIQDRINRLRLEVDVYLHDRDHDDTRGYEHRGSKEKDE